MSLPSESDPAADLHIRFPVPLARKLHEQAAKRLISKNRLVTIAVESFLDEIDTNYPVGTE